MDARGPVQAALNEDGTIETPRLRLRPIRAGDAGLYRALYTDPGVMRHLGGPLPLRDADRHFGTVLRIEASASWPAYRVVVLDGTEIGLVALQRRRSAPRSAEAGAMLQPQSAGRALGAEAVAGLVDWAFAHCRVDEVHTRSATGNIAAWRMMAEHGFEPRPGRNPAQLYWRMTAGRWRERGPLLARMAPGHPSG